MITSKFWSRVSAYVENYCLGVTHQPPLSTAQCALVQSTVLRSHVVRLHVRPSVTLVICDYIGWKSWKLIAQAISQTPSLFVAKRRSTYSQGNMGKLWGAGRLVVGYGKRDVLENQSGNISATCKDRGKVTIQPTGTHKSSFERYHPRPLRPPLVWA